MSPQVWRPPAAIAVKLRPPLTRCGVKPAVRVPLPSWPKSFNPQQYASPVIVRPHEWDSTESPVARPEVMAVKLNPPCTATGVVEPPPPVSPKNWKPQIGRAHV